MNEKFKLSHAVLNFDNMPDSAHIRPKDAIQILSISSATFWRLKASGKLKTHKLTRRTTTVKVEDLRNFLNQS